MLVEEDVPRVDGVSSPGRALTEADAVEIWIARWLRIPRLHLVRKYGCDSRRLYEIWWGDRFPASRAKAAEQFKARYPALTERTVFGYRRIPRASNPADHRAQTDLFA